MNFVDLHLHGRPIGFFGWSCSSFVTSCIPTVVSYFVEYNYMYIQYKELHYFKNFVSYYRSNVSSCLLTDLRASV